MSRNPLHKKRRILAWLTRPEQKGFSLLELLVALAVASVFFAFTAGIIVQVMRADRQQTARSETQAEVQSALDYIRRDLTEATFIYSGAEMQTVVIAPGRVPVAAGSVPVLAFWKIEPLPTGCQQVLSGFPQGSEQRTDSQTNNVYSLIVYFWRPNTSGVFINDGPARIERYELRKYRAAPNCTPTPGYITPPAPDFINLPAPGGINAGVPGGSADTLVAFIDGPTIPLASLPPRIDPAANGCPPVGNYNPSPQNPDAANRFAFYACVRQQTAATQDAFVYIRGNGLRRAFSTIPPSAADLLPDNSYRPVVQTQVFARSAFR